MGTFDRNRGFDAGHLLANALGGPGSTGNIYPATAYRVRSAIARAVRKDVSQVGLDDDFASLGGDSILRVTVLVSLETEFKVRITDTAGRRFKTGRDLAFSIQSSLALEGGQIAAPFIPGGSTLSAAISGVGNMKKRT